MLRVLCLCGFLDPSFQIFILHGATCLSCEFYHIPMVSRNFRAQCAYLSGLRPCKVFLYFMETNLRNSAPNQSIQLKVETELITNNHFPASSQSVQVLRAICLVAIHRSKMMTDGCKKERKVGKELSNWVYIPLGHFQSNTSP